MPIILHIAILQYRSDLSHTIRIHVHYRLSDLERFARNVSAFNEIRNASQRYNFTVSRCTVAPCPTREYNSMVHAYVIVKYK